MVLNYLTTNYIGWPLPAFYKFINYSAKIQKLFELRKYFGNYF